MAIYSSLHIFPVSKGHADVEKQVFEEAPIRLADLPL
jgi:hypothetical protein